jgi:hypothetical protein
MNDFRTASIISWTAVYREGMILKSYAVSSINSGLSLRTLPTAVDTL